MDIASALQNHMFKAPILAGSPFVRSLGVVPVQLAHSFFGFAGRGQKNSEELEILRTDPSGFLIHHLARSLLRTSLLYSALRFDQKNDRAKALGRYLLAALAVRQRKECYNPHALRILTVVASIPTDELLRKLGD